MRVSTFLVAALCFTLSALGEREAQADASRFVLIGQDLRVSEAQLVSLDLHTVRTRQLGNRERSDRTDQFIAIAAADVEIKPSRTGMLELADGQRLPGEAVASADEEDVLAWRHPWLGRIDVPLDDVLTVQFRARAALPEQADADVVLLTNGDRLEGFIAGLSDPVLLEVQRNGEVRLLELPLRNVASVRLIAPHREPEGVRLWVTDGTIVDVHDVQIEESGRARMSTRWHGPEDPPTRLMAIEIAAILLDPSAMVPLATLPVHRVDGPITRFEVPKPHVLKGVAVLGLADIELIGPLVARYSLPPHTTRFAAEAILPEISRAWGDFELIVRDGREELFRARLNRDNPSATIHVDIIPTLTDGELTIEMGEGAYGPIHDRLILQQPMLLVQPPG